MEYNTPQKCKVIKVLDGDTIDCETIPDGEVYRVRLDAIDAPEMNQPAGWESKYGLYKMLENLNFEFFLIPKCSGTNGRLIGDLYPDEMSAKNLKMSSSLNYKMCVDGLAWYYTLDGNGANIIKTAEEMGRSNNSGLWNRRTSEPIHPSKWRHENSKMNTFLKSSEMVRKLDFLRSHKITMDELTNKYPKKTIIKKEKKPKEINVGKISDIGFKKTERKRISESYIPLNDQRQPENLKTKKVEKLIKQAKTIKTLSALAIDLSSNLDAVYKTEMEALSKENKLYDFLKSENVQKRIKKLLTKKEINKISRTEAQTETIEKKEEKSIKDIFKKKDFVDFDSIDFSKLNNDEYNQNDDRLMLDLDGECNLETRQEINEVPDFSEENMESLKSTHRLKRP